jgi:hypothetical protein
MASFETLWQAARWKCAPRCPDARPSPWPSRYALTETNSDVDKVLEIMGRVEKLDWFALCKVYEIIEKAIGETDSSERLGHQRPTNCVRRARN